MVDPQGRPKPPGIKERLTLVEDGLYGPGDARGAVRLAFATKSPDTIRAMGYAALRAVAWRLMRQADLGDAAGWAPVFQTAIELCIDGSRTEEAARLSALAELLEQRVRFDEANADGALASKATVRHVAKILGTRYGSLPLRELCAETGMPEEIGARVVGAMSATGYVVVEGDGKRRAVSLTADGMALAATL